MDAGAEGSRGASGASGLVYFRGGENRGCGTRAVMGGQGLLSVTPSRVGYRAAQTEEEGAQETHVHVRVP